MNDKKAKAKKVLWWILFVGFLTAVALSIHFAKIPTTM